MQCRPAVFLSLILILLSACSSTPTGGATPPAAAADPAATPPSATPTAQREPAVTSTPSPTLTPRTMRPVPSTSTPLSEFADSGTATAPEYPQAYETSRLPTTDRSSFELPPAAPLAEVTEEHEQIITAVERLRGLEARQEVAFQFMGRDALRARLETELAEEADPAEIESSDQALKLLGLIPDETHLRDLILDLYTSQIAGFYDAEEDRFFLVSENQSGALPATDRVTFAHEFVHALQDQYYDLEALRADELDLNGDEQQAIQAVIEGDAQTITALYIFEHLDEADRNDLVASSREVDQLALSETPPYLRDSLVFPYTAGQAFVQAQILQGGRQALDRLYANMPQSTEQILHPERYPSDTPQAVTLPDIARALGGTWKERQRETWGEFDLRLILAQVLPIAEAIAGATGWDGDQTLLLGDDSGNTALIQAVVWDSVDEAAEFRHAFKRWLAASLYTAGNEGIWEAADRAGTVLHSGETTTVIIAKDRRTVSAVATALEHGYE